MCTNGQIEMLGTPDPTADKDPNTSSTSLELKDKMKQKNIFSWPERIVGYLLLGYLGYVLVCMILGTFDIL